MEEKKREKKRGRRGGIEEGAVIFGERCEVRLLCNRVFDDVA